MDHITAFPRPAAPELPPHRLRSCQDCRTFPESQWMLSIGCFLFCILRDDRKYYKMDGFLHIYLSLCFLKTAAASCDPGAEILFSADALFSTVTLAKPVVTHPSRTIRAITFGRSTLLHRTFLFSVSSAAGPRTTSLPYRCPVRSRRFSWIRIRLLQPQFFVCPFFRCESSTVHVFPQSH